MLSKFNNLPWLVRFAVMLTAAGGVWYGFHYFVLSATAAETAQMSERRDTLRAQNQQGAVVQARLTEFKARFEQLKIEYDQTKQLLPEAVEISRVLENIQMLAKNKLTVKSFVPHAEEQQKDFYRVRSIKIEVTGSYPALESFFQQVADLKRIVNIGGLEIEALQEQREGQSLKASFAVSAMYAEPQDVNNLKPLAPKPADGNAANAAPGAVAPPAPAAGATPPPPPAEEAKKPVG
jgi:type IV pilus assembly protein PilO